MRYPMVGSAALVSLFVALKFLPKHLIGYIIMFYFCGVGTLAIGGAPLVASGYGVGKGWAVHQGHHNSGELVHGVFVRATCILYLCVFVRATLHTVTNVQHLPPLDRAPYTRYARCIVLGAPCQSWLHLCRALV
jgi:hypothetical protein